MHAIVDILIIALSAIALKAFFLLVKRKDDNPIINSYIPIQDIAAGSGSGFFRFTILRLIPPCIVFIGETALLKRFETNNVNTLPMLLTTVTLFVFPTYIAALRKAFTFKERVISLIMIITYFAAAILIWGLSSIFDFSILAPSNLQSFIDNIWATIIAALIVVSFFELLRNDPAQKNQDIDNYNYRVFSLVEHRIRILGPKYFKIINDAAKKYNASQSLLKAIIIYEDLNRPAIVRKLENILVLLPGAKMTVGIAQVEATIPLSDEMSIYKAAQQLSLTHEADLENTITAIRRYNPSEKYINSVLQIQSIVSKLDSPHSNLA
ncbi:hypothetical protein [Bifidobacterium platyrrhinorum]|uniref:Uncharacterized protein n=1 Tax=Bifidobacterium platyrrhinorum TaxID=2661628 RepID=A0A6L9SSR9_9BIFI|nr:hypothetical protein [Bifidobacterium platyrrhinorum]NEG54863.1 hypothetical protein [Bifidobacterium platyrrhinorum]